MSGTADYRIVRIGQDGNSSYSTVCTITISHTASTIGIFPNPATGHTFYLSTPNTARLFLNIYTLTGQLIMRTALEGQTQYPVQLPSQLLPGATVIVQAILPDQSSSFPLLLR